MNGLTASRVLTLDMSTTKNITWVAAYGYHGYYEVSDFGDVRNIAKRKGSSVGRVLKKRVTKDGYVKALLRNQGNDKGVFIHRLVVESFVGPISQTLEVDHLDGNRGNNRLSNLEVVSRLENMRRSFKNGRPSARGTAQHRSVFTEIEVISIRARVLSGEKQKDIASEFGVTNTAINCIVKRKTWMHLP